MSWRERYKNHEARFDQHIKVFQHKNKLSRQAIPMGSEAMLVNRMEDLDDFGTDEEDEGRRPQGKKPTRVDSDTEDEDWELARAQTRPTRKAVAAPEQPASKRKRVSDASDRTPKRTRVAHSSKSGGGESGSPTDDPTRGRENDAMNQDSQGEETLEVEQNLFYPSDEDSLTIPRWVAPSSHPVNRIVIPVGQHANTGHQTASLRRSSCVHFQEPPYSSTRTQTSQSQKSTLQRFLDN